MLSKMERVVTGGRYNPVFFDHFDAPRHVGELDPAVPATGVAECGDPHRGESRLRIGVRLAQNGCIEAVAFKAYGNSATIAACSWACDRIQGRPASEAADIDPAEVAAALALPAEERGAAVRVCEAIAAAVTDSLASPAGDA
ncbi:MAG: iron-sulfur cluster assembly scaffold protein [Pseudomonadota bacterium]